MQEKDSRSLLELVPKIRALIEEVASLARNSAVEVEIFNEFANIIEKFTPILNDIEDNNKAMDTIPIRKSVESIKKELRRVKSLIKISHSRFLVKHINDLCQDIRRSLGLLLFASTNLKLDIKDKIRALHEELMYARFDKSSSPSWSPRPSCESVFVSDLESEKGAEITEEKPEIEEHRISLGIDDVGLQLKYGDDKQLKFAITDLNEMISGKKVDSEWINEGEIISILFNRLGSSKPKNRLSIIQTLRSLASENADFKEKMADAAALSALVKSLSGEVEEQRETLGMLLDLSDHPAFCRRVGRIQGCIVMLVAIVSGDDPVASHNARNLLNVLSTSTQNALHIAEAGYFKPLVHYLQEGSDMSKIIVATTLSRMELTDQGRTRLGEDGAIEPLVRMFKIGKLEAKLSALNALQNLSMLAENIVRIINSDIVVSLLQLLFSVTSAQMTLREPASAILARIAQSESILVNHDVAQQMLSLLNLSSPVIQYHLLQALNNIASHYNASNVRRKMKENGAIQLLLPFLTETNINIRTAALDVIYTLSKDVSEELTEPLGESHLNIIVNIISSSTSDCEKAAAVGILSNLPINNRKTTDLLKKMNLLSILVSKLSSSTVSTSNPVMQLLAEGIAGLVIWFTIPTDRRLQLFSAEHGVIPMLVKLLSNGSTIAKSRAADSLAQLSQNSFALGKTKKSKWLCVPQSADAFCDVHDCYCSVKSTFCLLKAGAVSPLIQILESEEREADDAVLAALATLLQDETWESGSKYIAKMSGIQAIIKVLESGNLKTQEKAVWILERIFRVEEHRMQYGESAQVVLIDLDQNGHLRLKSTIADLLSQLGIFQAQSC